MKILYLFADSKRRENISSEEERYLLYGLDEINNQPGYDVLDSVKFEASLETHKLGKIIDKFFNRLLRFLGGYGGSFYKILKMRKFIRGTVLFLWGISLIVQILGIEKELGFKEFIT